MASNTSVEGVLVLPNGEPLFDGRFAGRTVAVSQIIAEARRPLNIYGERLFWRLVRLAQIQTLGADYKQLVNIGQVDIGPLGAARVEIPIRSLLSDGSTHYEEAKEALLAYMNTSIDVERPKIVKGKPVLDEFGKPEYALVAFQWFNKCTLNVKPGIAIIEVNDLTWSAFLDYSKGIRPVDIASTSQFHQRASSRLLMLLSGQSSYGITIDRLRYLFAMDKKDPDTGEYELYPKTHMFIKRIITPAVNELNEKTQYWITATTKKNSAAAVNRNRRGQKAITSILFTVRKKTAVTDGKAVLPVGTKPTARLSPETQKYLTEQFGFTVKGLDNNAELFRLCAKVGLKNTFLRSITKEALKADSPQGYVIFRLKKELETHYGVQFDEKGRPVLDGDGNPVITKKGKNKN